jgi:4-carboxymuconolactone decarboxylase
MRLPLIPPTDLTPEQRGLYEDMRKGISSKFNAFKAVREDGALMGPWNPWLHEPGIGNAIRAAPLCALGWPTTISPLE